MNSRPWVNIFGPERPIASPLIASAEMSTHLERKRKETFLSWPKVHGAIMRYMIWILLVYRNDVKVGEGVCRTLDGPHRPHASRNSQLLFSHWYCIQIWLFSSAYLNFFNLTSSWNGFIVIVYIIIFILIIIVIWFIIIIIFISFQLKWNKKKCKNL